ncbi:monovalent cation/H+ antiporter subunit D family protein [bacterium]|nr:monovalent cation/H+ antiporter subunit D family protein [bacterium]
MILQYPALLITLPLIAAFIITAFGWLNQRFCYPIAVITLTAALYISVELLLSIFEVQIISYRLGGWPPPIGIEYKVDHLNAFVLVLITLVALLNLVAAKPKVDQEFKEKSGAFYALYVLFVTGLLGITITGDAFNLYVLLEITALTGYALIGLGRSHAPLAGLNYVFMGTIGASFYLLGIGYLYLTTGSLNMADLATLIPALQTSKTIVFGFVLCLIGLFIKMALFPLHNWLPNAYSYSPSAASSLIAPLTTKVMIYVMIRLVFSLFTPAFSFSNQLLTAVVVWIAIVAIVMGSVLALAQKNLFKMLSFIIIAEVGYMVGGFWLGNSDGMTGAILHIANDALMTLCLFLAVGNIKYMTKIERFEDLKGIISKMPVSMTVFIIGGFSIIGVPPTCGFFSKWYLIKGGIVANQWGFVIALLFSSLVNTILFFRIIEIGFFSSGDNSNVKGHGSATIREAPIGMLIPALITAGLLVLSGLYTNEFVTYIILPVMP